jgi:uncharacterized membrane protein
LSETPHDKARRWRGRGLLVATAVGYPLVAHVQVLAGEPFAAVLMLLGLFTAALIVALLNGGRAVAIVLFCAIVGCASLLAGGAAGQILYLQPIVINVLLATLFAGTLRTGRVPLITAYARALDGKLSPAQITYTRRLTAAWALFFGIMALESFLLAAYAPVALWSLFTNVLNPVFVICFFIVEYAIRKRALPDVDHPGFFRFVGRLATTGMRRPS